MFRQQNRFSEFKNEQNTDKVKRVKKEKTVKLPLYSEMSTVSKKPIVSVIKKEIPVFVSTNLPEYTSPAFYVPIYSNKTFQESDDEPFDKDLECFDIDKIGVSQDYSDNDYDFCYEEQFPQISPNFYSNVIISTRVTQSLKNEKNSEDHHKDQENSTPSDSDYENYDLDNQEYYSDEYYDDYY